MDISSINSDLIRGNVTTIILKALMTEDRYGYDILKEIEVKSGGQYKLKQPTLYSCLKRLEKQGLISSYWGDESDTEGGRRRYYALTETGRSYLNKMQSEYEYSRTILDNLLSEEKFDFEKNDAPFDINSLRPYTKRTNDDDNSAEEKPAVATAVSDTEKTVVQSPRQDIPENVSKTSSQPKLFEENINNSQMFSPLDKGQGSFDNGYRHSSKSVIEMLGKIDEIMGKKSVEQPDVTKEAELEKGKPVVELEKEKPVADVEAKKETVVNVVDSTETASSSKPVTILSPHDPVVNTAPKNNENINDKRDAAKRVLGIGAYQEKRNDVIENTAAKNENHSVLGQIDKLVANDDVVENKPVEKKFDLFSKVPIDQQLHPEKYADKTVDEPKPEVNKDKEIPLTDPRMIFEKYNKKESEPLPEKKPIKVELEPSPVPPASTFSFRKDTDSVINYRDAFGGLRKSESVPTANIADSSEFIQKPASNIDLKTKLFSEGYKLRTYSRENTESYYSMNYIKKNRINRDCYAIMYVLICLEVFFGWLIFKDRFSPIAYAAVCIAALLVPAIPFVIWTVNPDKRVRGNYNFRTSILNRCMLYLNLLVIDCLIGFFGVGANINVGASMIAPILVPALLLLNIPFSSVIYLILYKTKRYHIS